MMEPCSHLGNVPARLDEDVNNFKAALEGGFHRAQRCGFCGVTGDGHQVASGRCQPVPQGQLCLALEFEHPSEGSLCELFL